jgi:hypothetical protein
LLQTRDARFFSVQHTKTGKNIPHNHKIYQIYVPNIPQNKPNYRKIDQMATSYTNIFDCETLRNLPKLEFLVCHLATLLRTPKKILELGLKSRNGSRKISYFCVQGKSTALTAEIDIAQIST